MARRAADDTLIAALACGATAEAAAQKSGVAVTDVRRLMRDREFRLLIQTARVEMVERTAALLTAAAFESVRTLIDLQGPSHTDVVRLGAAKAIVELGAKTREKAEELARFAELEMESTGA